MSYLQRQEAKDPSSHKIYYIDERKNLQGPLIAKNKAVLSCTNYKNGQKHGTDIAFYKMGYSTYDIYHRGKLLMFSSKWPRFEPNIITTGEKITSSL